MIEEPMDEGDRARAEHDSYVDARATEARDAIDGRGREMCEDCGALIALVRRRAAPWAPRCRMCQAELEGSKK